MKNLSIPMHSATIIIPFFSRWQMHYVTYIHPSEKLKNNCSEGVTISPHDTLPHATSNITMTREDLHTGTAHSHLHNGSGDSPVAFCLDEGPKMRRPSSNGKEMMVFDRI